MTVDLERDLVHLGELLRRTSEPITLPGLRERPGSGPGPVAEAATGGHDGAIVVDGHEPRRRGWRLAAAALVAVAASVVGLLAVVDRGRGEGPLAPATSLPEPDTSSTLTNSTLPDVAAVPTTPPSTVAASLVERLRAYTGWYFPSFLPNGYEPYEIVSSPTTAPDPTTRRWTRIDATGKTTGTLTITTQAIPPEDSRKPTQTNATIHGIAALTFDSGEGIVVTWPEAGLQLHLRAEQFTTDQALAIAQATTVDATGTVALTGADGLVPVDAGAVNVQSVTLTISLVRADGAPSLLFVTSTANIGGDTLDTIRHRIDQGSRTTTPVERIGGIDRLVQRIPPDANGPLTHVTWLQDGMVFDVIGRTAPDDVVRMAGSIEPVDPQHILDEGNAITTRLHAKATLDQATLTDGTVVTVKTLGQGPVGICVETPEPICRWDPGAILAGRHDAAFAVFTLPDHSLLLAWYNTDARPVLIDNGTIGSRQPATAAETPTEVQATGSGHIIEVVVQPNQPTPAVRLGPAMYNSAQHPTELLHY